jgi:hypothetical protein
MESAMSKVLLPAAVALGLLIAYVDSRPNWDDTGVIAAAVFAVSGLWGVLGPERPWLWALAVGGWIPVFAIVARGEFASLLALAFAFAGAYAGMGVRRAFRTVRAGANRP